MNILLSILWVIIGYFFGSIPFALVIGKVFYNKDIREHGSGNLGGSNAGRVLGPLAGASVILLDALKAFIVMTLCNKYAPNAIIFAGLATCIVHCYPFFANFKGGKAVATSFGFLLALGIYVTKDVIFAFVFPVLMFLIVLGLTKIVSISSMTSMLFEAIVGFLTYKNNVAAFSVLFLALFIIFRHIPNIKRIINKKETKVRFLS